MLSERFIEIKRDFPKLSVAVVGDIMLDHYLHGRTNRISAEAPVPVIEVEQQSHNLGGAANVANNLLALGTRPLLFGAIGSDAPGETIIGQMHDLGMETGGLIGDRRRPTTVKMRAISRGQQVARMDIESTVPIHRDVEQELVEKLTALITSVDAVIFEDYNKGVLTPSLIREVVSLCRRHGKIVTVDPKFENFFAYTGVTVFKPNQLELETGAGQLLRTDEDILETGRNLLARLACENIVITLGADGIAIVDSSTRLRRLPAKIRTFRDSSGAGDTFIAVLTATLAAGATVVEAAALANYAAGVTCEKLGVQIVTAQEILEAIRYHEIRELKVAVSQGGSGH